jgi:hypothetical protein
MKLRLALQHTCDACGGTGAKDCAKYADTAKEDSGRGRRMKVALGWERKRNPCPVCGGRGVISDVPDVPITYDFDSREGVMGIERMPYVARNLNGTWGCRTWDARVQCYREGVEYRTRREAREALQDYKYVRQWVLDEGIGGGGE